MRCTALRRFRSSRNIFRTSVATCVGSHAVQLIGSEKIYSPSVNRKVGLHFIPAVLVRTGNDASANLVAVLVRQSDFIVLTVRRLLRRFCLRLVLPIVGEHLVELLLRCVVKAVQVALQIILMLAVRIHIPRKHAASFRAVRVAHLDLPRSVLAPRLCLHLLALRLSPLHTSAISRVNHRLTILFTHGHNGLSAVGTYIHRPVAVIRKAFFIGNNLHLRRLSVLTNHIIDISRIKRHLAVDSVGFLLCKLLAYSFRCCLFLHFGIHGSLYAQYGIGRHHIKCTAICIAYCDGLARLLAVYARAVVIRHKVAVHHIHPAVIALLVLHLQRRRLYHARLAVHSAVNRRIALSYTPVNIIAHPLHHPVIHLLGIDVVNHDTVCGFIVSELG